MEELALPHVNEQIHEVRSLAAGYVVDVVHARPATLGVGVRGAINFIPRVVGDSADLARRRVFQDPASQPSPMPSSLASGSSEAGPATRPNRGTRSTSGTSRVADSVIIQSR